MWLIFHHFQFLILVLILVIMILYRYQDHYHHIRLRLGRLHVRPDPRLLLRQSLPQFILQDIIQGFLHQILCLHFLSFRPKWVFLVPIQTLDISQRWVVSQNFLVPLPSWQLNPLWIIWPNHCCESLPRCTATWRSSLHNHYIPLNQYWGCFFSSMFLLCLYIPCHRIQKYSLRF